MSYKPPMCETTGIVIERDTSQSLNGTTTLNSSQVILNDLRYIQYEPGGFKQDENGYQNAETYRLYLQNPDSLRVGDKVKFNGSLYMQKQAFTQTLQDVIELQVKQIENYQINCCEGYIEAICISYN